MERPTLEIKLDHAEGLCSVKFFGKMDIYAVVSISDEHNDRLSLKNKSPVDVGGDTTPVWNFMMKFKVDEAALQTDSLTLRFKLTCQQGFLGDAAVGDAEISVKHLFDLSAKAAAAGAWSCTTLPVRKPDGIPQGNLSFSYKFSEKTASHAPPPPPPPPPTVGDSWYVKVLGIVLPIIVNAVIRNMRN